jgi:hypothetical protein
VAELKKYTSFEAMKVEEKSTGINRYQENIFHEFEAFITWLQNEHSNKKKAKTHNGKQPDQ